MHDRESETTSDNNNPPLALHLGFAGSRILWPEGWTEQQRDQAHQRLVDLLCEEIQGLKAKLGLQGTGCADDRTGHFWVGISQVAIGADAAFHDACTRLGIPMRVFLPQPSDVYLSAEGSQGPDFNEKQRAEAQARLDHPITIQERVVGKANDRHQRFTETNAEIQHIADVVMTLQIADAGPGQAGGTNELAEMAKRHGKPVFSLTLSVNDQQAPTRQTLTEETLTRETLTIRSHDSPSVGKFQCKRVWLLIQQLELTRDNFIDTVKNQASTTAAALQQRFTYRTRVVIGAHVAATAVAALMLCLSYAATGYFSAAIFYTVLYALLLLELALLGWGFHAHGKLHHDADSEHWAQARLLAEVMRSANMFGPGVDRVEEHGRDEPVERPFPGQNTHLRYLFELPLPQPLLPVAETVNILHLCKTRSQRDADWRDWRDRYVRERLLTTVTKNRGQLLYYKNNAESAHRVAEKAHQRFKIATGTAIVATTIKLALLIVGWKLAPVAAALSWFAILAPVAAVAFLSLAASLDQHARANHFSEMKDFLEAQVELLKSAETRSEFLRLQADTEIRLLGETVSWYYRRRYTNPS